MILGGADGEDRLCCDFGILRLVLYLLAKGRKANLLEDKQISSVGLFDERAFGGNTRDLDSIWEETDEITTLHEFQYQKSIQWLEMASQSMATASGRSSDGVKILVMASELADSKEP
ncbi:hypothetical protein Tco_1314126 [Tanacetum coccineum]